MFVRWLMVSLFLACGAQAADALAPEFEAALKSFRADGARGWGFTQSTASRTKSLVERFDPSKPEFNRWSLISIDGKAPTEKEARDYAEKQTRRSSPDNAPDVVKQIDFATAERVSEDAEHIVYRFHLTPGGKDDSSAAHMRATYAFHKPTHTIDRFELGSFESFSPMFGVNVQEAQTVITYTLPTADRPSLLDHITVRVRGRAMWIKSLDEDMTVTYSDYRYAYKKPANAVNVEKK